MKILFAASTSCSPSVSISLVIFHSRDSRRSFRQPIAVPHRNFGDDELIASAVPNGRRPMFSATPITTQDFSSVIEVTEHLTAHETDSVRTSTFVSRNLNYLPPHMLAAHRSRLRSLRGSSVDDLITFSRRLELVRIERAANDRTL